AGVTEAEPGRPPGGTVGQDLIVETERLVLRPWTMNDAEALEAVLNDPVAMEFYPAPLTREGVEGWIRKNLARYEKDGCGLYAMALKESGEVVGDCGCIVQQVEEREQLEIAYHVRRNLWGNGYATETARSCMDYAFDRMGAH